MKLSDHQQALGKIKEQCRIFADYGLKADLIFNKNSKINPYHVEIIIGDQLYKFSDDPTVILKQLITLFKKRTKNE